MKKILAAALILFPVVAFAASGYGVVRPLLVEYERLNSVCKGGGGNSDATREACDNRAPISQQLRDHGWCWKGPTEDAAEYKKSWQECGPGKFDNVTKDGRPSLPPHSKPSQPIKSDMPPADRAQYCRNFATALTVISAARDTGQSPESALKQIKSVDVGPLEIKKNLVNYLYFDPAGLLIYNTHGLNSPIFQASEACLRDFKPRFEPLK